MKSNSKTNSKKKKKAKCSVKPASSSDKSFPVVGVGASAGGLEAFIQVFAKMPVDTGMAFVLIQHLDPTHESMSSDIISRSCKLKVEEVTDGTLVKPNHIYMIPPNYIMRIEEGVLKLSARDTIPGKNMVIDQFFQSLAKSEKSRAIGIVLSGTGSDGTTGLSAIKAEGGVCYAQEPASAKYPSMPQSAIDAGNVDLILNPEDIASELSKIRTHPYIASTKTREHLPEDKDATEVQDPLSEDSTASTALTKLFQILHAYKKVDFTDYKQSTIMRRIHRRMIVQKIKSLTDYVEYLENHEEEVHALYNDMLINVTEFFRDPESFKALEKLVFPAILKNKSKGSRIRIWVPGCSTGEEAYSIAISLWDFLKKSDKQFSVQIFATDVSEQAIQKARKALYSESLVQDIPKEQLKRFFEKVDGGYQINKAIRDFCLFSRHDIASDPPFAKLDLISCRNVMIYFSKPLQKRVIPIFHYALLPSRFLWFGRSENLGGFSQLFSLVEKEHKIYSKSNVPTPTIHLSSKQSKIQPNMMTKSSLSLINKNGGDFQKDADRILLSKYSPPGVVVNADLEILQFRGRTIPFLEPATGQPSLNLLKMARPELSASLRAAIQSVKKENKSIERLGLHFESEGKLISLDLEVIPIDPKASDKEKTFLILFKKKVDEKKLPEDKQLKVIQNGKHEKQSDKDQRILELVNELSELKDYQQSLIEQYETTQEELTSTNEELQSTNEEFQSTNEEIETAKEELQSTNEELITVNEELQVRNSDLTILSSDLKNLLASIDIPILIVDGDHRIRRFSPKAKSALNLIPSDVGRPISDIRPSFDVDLSRLITEVSETLRPKKIEIEDFNGKWLRLQIRPYQTVDNKIDGAVLSLMDIDEIKKREEKTTEAYIQADKANLAKDVFLATLSHELRTPLSSILTWAQLIAQKKVGLEEARRGAAVIEQNAKTQNQLIDDLLDISKIIIGKLAIKMESVDPAVVIRSAIESVKSVSEKKSVQIDAVLPDSTERIHADPTRLQQIIWNLLNNAINFSPKKTIVKIELKYIEEINKRFAQIRVSDQGKGIDPKFLPHIFNRFSQADGTSTRAIGGLGLGLSIVHSLVELQSGSVKAENASQGKGAIFTVRFPVISEQTAITKADPDKEDVIPSNDKEGITNQPITLDGIRVLIIDDDENTREAISIYLKSFGAEVMTADSASKALEVFANFQPTILISDIAMPGEDGYTLIQKIRKLDSDSGGDVPALALSAYTTEEDVKHSLEAGFQAHLTKPVEANELARIIVDTLR